MKQMPFEPPTPYYNDKIKSIDEQICDLIRRRKDLSNNDPGFPTKELITNWAGKYNMHEEYLNSVFSHFLSEEIYRPIIEPKGFLKTIQILKSLEKNDCFYTVTFIRQYKNASVIHFTVDTDISDEEHEAFPEHKFFELSIVGGEIEYDCRNEGGGGSGCHTAYTFVVSPPLPDDVSGYELQFSKSKMSYHQNSGGSTFVISIK
ncbi:hypothetical protein NSQ77_10655 [Oceanobacillus sp. FSL K6-2867]|uniref:hypothetical protein n=1 Tax=Oceanobacillus sp. FSL K6-2867 TaxID=2954748 RepID=UPI0030D8A06E